MNSVVPYKIDQQSMELFVKDLYKYILHRNCSQGEVDHWVNVICDKQIGPQDVLKYFTGSQERKAIDNKKYISNIDRKISVNKNYNKIGDFYSTPMRLSRSKSIPRRIVISGTCLMNRWVVDMQKYTQVDWVFSGNFDFPKIPPADPSEYGFHIVHLTWRFLCQENKFLNLNYSDYNSYEVLFEEVCNKMSLMLKEHMQWNQKYGILTFVCNFLVSQKNMRGRLMPKYDLRNFGYFIQKANEHLHNELRTYNNAYILDIDEISSVMGKMFIVDDSISVSTHQSTLGNGDGEFDRDRIEKLKMPLEYYSDDVKEFVEAVWWESLSMFRTVHQEDAVKLVICDLDDSLWRGIAAEGAHEKYGAAVHEGWPGGVMEALITLKNRGILLAIASKNDENRIEELWDIMTWGAIKLTDFAVKKINWRPKVENIKEILSEVNILPKNVLFIDDNPVERASVQEAFPDIRVLGENPYIVRRTLLWAAETQVAAVSDESARRTEMIQAQVKRETDRKSLSHEEFLQSLNIKIKIHEIKNIDDTKFARAFELINKTNQFNTTGERWTHEHAMKFFQDSGLFLTFDVEDIYSHYGLVGVIVIQNSRIIQWVMSCRVLGMNIELAMLAGICRKLRNSGEDEITGTIVKTESNYPCRDLFERGGFNFDGNIWKKSLKDPSEDQEFPYIALM